MPDEHADRTDRQILDRWAQGAEPDALDQTLALPAGTAASVIDA